MDNSFNFQGQPEEANEIKLSNRWSDSEDNLLIKIMSKNLANDLSWTDINTFFTNKSAKMIEERWIKLKLSKFEKDSFSTQEDKDIINFVKQNGFHQWQILEKTMKGRTEKQIKERYFYYLAFKYGRQNWTKAEDKFLVNLHDQYGNAWTKIASFIPSKAEACVKARWNYLKIIKLNKIDFINVDAEIQPPGNDGSDVDQSRSHGNKKKIMDQMTKSLTDQCFDRDIDDTPEHIDHFSRMQKLGALIDSDQNNETEEVYPLTEFSYYPDDVLYDIKYKSTVTDLGKRQFCSLYQQAILQEGNKH